MNGLRWFGLSCLLLTLAVAGCGGGGKTTEPVAKNTDPAAKGTEPVAKSTDPAAKPKDPVAKPKDQIVGKWEIKEKEETTTFDFQKDGTLVLKTAKMELKGKYAFTSDDAFETTLKVGEKEEKETSKVDKIDNEKLIISDKKGEKKEFNKVK